MTIMTLRHTCKCYKTLLPTMHGLNDNECIHDSASKINMDSWHGRLGHSNAKTLVHVLKTMNVTCELRTEISFCNAY